MPGVLMKDVDEWTNEIAIVPTIGLANSQPREQTRT